jgi:hypothetical protein
MPSPLDFNSSKDGKNIPDSKKGFRDFLLSKTLKKPNGPQTYKAGDYQYQTQNEFSDIDSGGIGIVTGSSLTQTSTQNIYKPEQWFIKENLDTLPRRANLSLYPYFVSGDYTLYSIVNAQNFDKESELFKFAGNYIKKDTNGPVYSRIAQNVQKNTLGKNRLLDALNGNTNTAVNILTGKEPLIESNYNITVDNTLSVPGLITDFLSTTTGIEYPFSIIPGDVLTNPQNISNNPRPVPSTQLGKIWQDTTGALGSMFGIQRRPTNTRNPSDVLVEYMGHGQRNRLFDLLSYSKYAPNYTTTAMSQNTSKIFTFADKVAQGFKSALGIEAPAGIAYIGDDRGERVYYAMNDFNDNVVRGNYYLSLMFDNVATKLFHSPQKNRPISQGGPLAGELTWVSSNSKNSLGAGNPNFSSQQSALQDSLSVQYGFRQDSILGYTQQLLNSLPSNGGEARSHVANVIDQTSRLFVEGDVKLSRGNAVKYVSKFNGTESGVEYGRVWTKDRPYYSYGDTMPLNDVETASKYYNKTSKPHRRSNIRRFDASVLDNTWNINIAPMSNGNKSFDSSTNIVEKNKGQGDFYAKKYMFSIENLAWKTSNRSGYTVNDLPYCERGSNGGRVMWFPPYDLKVNETNNALWEENKFIGRPEPVYTYSNTSRNATVSFKVVVDHPSILNLLTREHFKNMSDEEANNYIEAFFAGIKDIDFYSLIQTYTTLDKNDIELIEGYLNNGATTQTINTFKNTSQPQTTVNKNNNVKTNQPSKGVYNFYYANDSPVQSDSVYNTSAKYGDLFTSYDSGTTINNLSTTLDETQASSNDNGNNDFDKKMVFGIIQNSGITSDQKNNIINTATGVLQNNNSDFTKYTGQTEDIKAALDKGIVTSLYIDVQSSSSAPASDLYNYQLSVRRLISIINDFTNKISKNNYSFKLDEKTIALFDKSSNAKPKILSLSGDNKIQIKLTDLGYDAKTVNNISLDINMSALGETTKLTTPTGVNCTDSYKSSNLKLYGPNSIYCRQSRVSINYEIKDNPADDSTQTPINKPITTTLDTETITIAAKKPNIDVMKRIIMKTLSECHYFKMLEENSPVVFKSLRDKLKYFHPGFHSMTPEGLNARLTFLLQCVRPGDTIPIKGINEATDFNARNTTFGPPPVCVLRIGDFYHSKMVIKDVNIDYNDGVWDMNPEGIGMQPMIANVTLQVSLIGGQGLEAPVDKLQNALSSNFFANTEMYDERSESSLKLSQIGNSSGFTKQFLEKLQNQPQYKKLANPTTPAKPSQGVFIGQIIPDTKTLGNIDYTNLVDSLYSRISDYVQTYRGAYNGIYTTWGPIISNIILSKDYRTINQYNLYTAPNLTPNTFSLFGEYGTNGDIADLSRGLKSAVITTLQSSSPTVLLGLSSTLGTANKKADDILLPFITDIVSKKLDSLTETKSITSLISARNKVIEVLDKLNFIIKYTTITNTSQTPIDVKIENNVYTKAELTGFTVSNFTSQYSSLLGFFAQVSNVFNDTGLDKISITDFTNPVVTPTVLTSLLKLLLNDQVNNIFSGFTDKVIFNDDLMKQLNDKFKNFIKTYDLVIKNIPTVGTRLSKTPIIYDIGSLTPLTDTNAIDEIKKVLSDKNTLSTTLNLFNHS